MGQSLWWASASFHSITPHPRWEVLLSLCSTEEGRRTRKFGVSVIVSITVIKHCDQSHPGRKMVSFILHISGHTPSLKEARAETQGENLEAEKEADAVEWCSLLAGFPWFAQTISSYTWAHMPGMIPPTMGWVIPCQSLIKKKKKVLQV